MAKLALKPVGLLLLPFLLSSSLSAVTVTDPVGVVKITVEAGVSASQPTLTFLSTSMSQDSGSTGTITIGSDDWTVNQFNGVPHYAIVASGPREGEILDIASNTVNTLTLSGGPATENQTDLSGESIRIHKHNTISSVFGSDPAVGTVERGSKETADQVLLHDGSYKTHYYNTVATSGPPFNTPLHQGWVNANSPNVDASNAAIYPDAGFIYSRVVNTGFDVSVSGQVITNAIKVPVISGYNLVTIPYPVDKSTTLGTAGLDALLTSGSKETADHVVIYDQTNKVYKTYYRNTVASSGPPFNTPFHQGWVNANSPNVDASAVDIPVGAGIFIFRRTGGAFNWPFQNVLTP
jgi:hypothetical protein